MSNADVHTIRNSSSSSSKVSSTNNKSLSAEEMLQYVRSELTNELNTIIQSIHAAPINSRQHNRNHHHGGSSSNSSNSRTAQRNTFANAVKEANKVLVELITFFDNIHNHSYTTLLTDYIKDSNNNNTNSSSRKSKLNKTLNREENVSELLSSFAEPSSYSSQGNKNTERLKENNMNVAITAANNNNSNINSSNDFSCYK